MMFGEDELLERQFPAAASSFAGHHEGLQKRHHEAMEKSLEFDMPDEDPATPGPPKKKTFAAARLSRLQSHPGGNVSPVMHLPLEIPPEPSSAGASPWLAWEEQAPATPEALKKTSEAGSTPPPYVCPETPNHKMEPPRKTPPSAASKAATPLSLKEAWGDSGGAAGENRGREGAEGRARSPRRGGEEEGSAARSRDRRKALSFPDAAPPGMAAVRERLTGLAALFLSNARSNPDPAAATMRKLRVSFLPLPQPHSYEGILGPFWAQRPLQGYLAHQKPPHPRTLL
jgi:hypothetical protein